MIALTGSPTSNRRAFRTRECCALLEVLLSGVVWSLAVIWLNNFDWAKQVVDQVPDPPPGLLSLFMAIYVRRP
jgi:hypothetical protein